MTLLNRDPFRKSEKSNERKTLDKLGHKYNNMGEREKKIICRLVVILWPGTLICQNCHVSFYLFTFIMENLSTF